MYTFRYIYIYIYIYIFATSNCASAAYVGHAWGAGPPSAVLALTKPNPPPGRATAT